MIIYLQILRLMMLVTIYVFGLRYQQNLTAAQPIEVEFIFGGSVLNNVNGFALVLTNVLVSVSSDGGRHFDSM